MTCDYDMEKLRVWQEKFELEKKFEYTKRYIKISRQDIPRKSITNLTQKFLPKKAKVVDVGEEELQRRDVPRAAHGACHELSVPIDCKRIRLHLRRVDDVTSASATIGPARSTSGPTGSPTARAARTAAS